MMKSMIYVLQCGATNMRHMTHMRHDTHETWHTWDMTHDDICMTMRCHNYDICIIAIHMSSILHMSLHYHTHFIDYHDNAVQQICLIMGWNMYDDVMNMWWNRWDTWNMWWNRWKMWKMWWNRWITWNMWWNRWNVCDNAIQQYKWMY